MKVVYDYCYSGRDRYRVLGKLLGSGLLFVSISILGKLSWEVILRIFATGISYELGGLSHPLPVVLGSHPANWRIRPVGPEASPAKLFGVWPWSSEPQADKVYDGSLMVGNSPSPALPANSHPLILIVRCHPFVLPLLTINKPPSTTKNGQFHVMIRSPLTGRITTSLCRTLQPRRRRYSPVPRPRRSGMVRGSTWLRPWIAGHYNGY